MRHAANCGLECVKQLLPNFASAGFVLALAGLASAQTDGTAGAKSADEFAVQRWMIGVVLLIVLAAVLYYVWWWRRPYLRFASAAMGLMAMAGLGGRVLAWFNVQGFGTGGFWVDAAPASIGWPSAVVACVALACDVKSRREAAADRNADVKSNKNRGVILQQSPITTRDNSPITINQGELGLADKLIEEAAKRGAAEQRVQSLEIENASLRDQVAAGVARVEQRAEAGDATAREAIRSARASRDAKQLLSVLLAEATKQEPAIRAAAADYLELHREIAAIAYVSGDIAEAERSLNVILRLAPDDLDATNNLGHIYWLRGELFAAEEQHKRILELAPDDDGWRAVALCNLGLIAQTRSDLDEAERLHRDALEIESRLGRIEGRAKDLGNLGVIAQSRGDLNEAERLHHEALELNKKLGRRDGQAIALGNLGLIAQSRGDLEEAERLHKESLEIERELGRLEGQAGQLGNLGMIAGKRGDLQGAECLHQEALALNNKLGRLEGQARQLGNLGLIAWMRNDLNVAERLLQESLDFFGKVGQLDGQAKSFINLGLIARTRGDVDAARRLLVQARDLYATIGMPQMVNRIQGRIDDLGP